jgi:hypothetical protein
MAGFSEASWIISGELLPGMAKSAFCPGDPRYFGVFLGNLLLADMVDAVNTALPVYLSGTGLRFLGVFISIQLTSMIQKQAKRDEQTRRARWARLANKEDYQPSSGSGFEGGSPCWIAHMRAAFHADASP